MKKLCVVGLAAFLPLAAHADIIPVETGVTGSGPFTWSYRATLTQDENANSGAAPSVNPVPLNQNTAFFTLYDFVGYVPGSCTAPTGWSCSVQNVGFTPADTAPSDNPSIVNLTFAYTSGATIDGPSTITGFSAESIQNQTAPIGFTGRATKNAGDQAGTTVDNIGSVVGPAPLPEPASLGLLGMAFAGLAFRRRKA